MSAKIVGSFYRLKLTQEKRTFIVSKTGGFRSGPEFAFTNTNDSMEAELMKARFTIIALLPLNLVGLLLLTMGYAAEEQRPNPCPDSPAVYIDGEFAECLNRSGSYKAYP